MAENALTFARPRGGGRNILTMLADPLARMEADMPALPQYQGDSLTMPSASVEPAYRALIPTRERPVETLSAMRDRDQQFINAMFGFVGASNPLWGRPDTMFLRRSGWAGSGEPLEVMVNPSARDVGVALRNRPALRTAWDPVSRKLYAWDAESALHREVIDQIGAQSAGEAATLFSPRDYRNLLSSLSE